MWSTPPADPPPTATFAGSAFSASVRSFTVLKGEFGATAIALYSIVSRASGVTCSRVTGDLFVRMPPTMIAPITIMALSLPFMVLTNSARPIVPPAPPLFVTWAPALWMPSASSAEMTERPVASQPPPGLAGTMSLMGSAASARSGTRASMRNGSIRCLIGNPPPLESALDCGGPSARFILPQGGDRRRRCRRSRDRAVRRRRS